MDVRALLDVVRQVEVRRRSPTWRTPRRLRRQQGRHPEAPWPARARASIRRIWPSTRCSFLLMVVAPCPEVQLEVHVEDVAVAAHGIGNGRVSDRALVQVEPLRVDAQPALLDEVPVHAGAQLRRVAVAVPGSPSRSRRPGATSGSTMAEACTWKPWSSMSAMPLRVRAGEVRSASASSTRPPATRPLYLTPASTLDHVVRHLARP